MARTEDGSPAQEAGLLRGDIILNVDGTPADKLSPEEIAALSRFDANYYFGYSASNIPLSKFEYFFVLMKRERRYQSQLSSGPRG